VNHHDTREDLPGLEVIGQFTTCAAKSYWIALVLTGDDKKASRIVASGIHEIADSGTVFGEWMCAWGIGVVIKACVALRADELRKEEGSGEYWRAKAAPLSTERLRQALLLLPLFPRFVYVLRVLEGYSLSYIASVLSVDKEACQAALTYSFRAFAQVLMSVQPTSQQ
jgi:DNA-directed RNA polymerase specialized sigma24 family protein